MIKMHMGMEIIGNERLGAMTSTILILHVVSIKKKDVFEYNSQKDIVPIVKRVSARAMKKGPAAPVTLSPHRSRVLKHLNTHFEQIMVTNKSLSSLNALKGSAEQMLLTLIDQQRVRLSHHCWHGTIM